MISFQRPPTISAINPESECHQDGVADEEDDEADNPGGAAQSDLEVKFKKKLQLSFIDFVGTWITHSCNQNLLIASKLVHFMITLKFIFEKNDLP